MERELQLTVFLGRIAGQCNDIKLIPVRRTDIDLDFHEVSINSIHRRLSRYSDACDAFAKAVELSPEDADLRTNLALALQKAGRDAEAKQAFADAKRLRPAT
jgi:tetratricopeptide (TPR) repeat protein